MKKENLLAGSSQNDKLDIRKIWLHIMCIAKYVRDIVTMKNSKIFIIFT